VQVQARLLGEEAFRDTVAVLQAGQARLRTHMRARDAERLQQNMQRCIALSRARAQRARRVERLKRNLDDTQAGVQSADPMRMHELMHTQSLPSAPVSGTLQPQREAADPDAGAQLWTSTGNGSYAPEPPGASSVSRAEHADDFSSLSHAFDDPDDPMLGSRAQKALASVVATLSYYAVHVHVMFGVVYVVDFSITTAVFPVASLLYALVAAPTGAFWQALLVYSEGLLLVQYVFQVALRAGCLALQRDTMRAALYLGLHDSAVRALSPLSAPWICLISSSAVFRSNVRSYIKMFLAELSLLHDPMTVSFL
jgi:hypothetical protein